jgi:hypothetical protein
MRPIQSNRVMGRGENRGEGAHVERRGAYARRNNPRKGFDGREVAWGRTVLVGRGVPCWRHGDRRCGWD